MGTVAYVDHIDIESDMSAVPDLINVIRSLNELDAYP
ncbi:hypothetical protein R70211_05311 [Paraburkholderia domus]|uniref:Uncharacterized protein n=1 Tax=Paraburkholderia domus TaxID=2793075 RepID=A0A9N8N197_9BURK|nr:hypothetical protein R70211_05311 [Paraburkholderia domus]